MAGPFLSYGELVKSHCARCKERMGYVHHVFRDGKVFHTKCFWLWIGGGEIDNSLCKSVHCKSGNPKRRPGFVLCADCCDSASNIEHYKNENWYGEPGYKGP